MINLLNNKWYIPLPDDATDIDMPEQDFGSVLQYKSNKRWNTITLPPGNWRILFTSDTATEEDCSKVVEKNEDGTLFCDYELYKGVFQNFLDTAFAAFASLLRSHNLQGRYLIIEKMD